MAKKNPVAGILALTAAEKAALLGFGGLLMWKMIDNWRIARNEELLWKLLYARSPAPSDLSPLSVTTAGGGGGPSAPSGASAPGGDTNLWWFPNMYGSYGAVPVRRAGWRSVNRNTCTHGNDRRTCNLCSTQMPNEFIARRNEGYFESGVKWLTGAEEGEGYLPDDWTFGTKGKAAAAAKETVITGAEAVGAGAAKAAGISEDKPLIPGWLLPTMALGTLGLGFYWISKK